MDAVQGAHRSSAAAQDAGEVGDMPNTHALLPIHKPSIAAFQSLIDTFANARDLRFAAILQESSSIPCMHAIAWVASSISGGTIFHLPAASCTVICL